MKSVVPWVKASAVSSCTHPDLFLDDASINQVVHGLYKPIFRWIVINPAPENTKGFLAGEVFLRFLESCYKQKSITPPTVSWLPVRL